MEWSNSVLVEGDAVDGIAALKQQDGPELQVHGSANLTQTLLRHDLVDQYRLLIFPVVLGSGKRLFAEGTIPAGLKLLDSLVSSTGVVMAPTSQQASSSPEGSTELTAIGAGMPVFPNLGTHRQLRLVTAQPFDCGITALHLEPNEPRAAAG